MHEETIGTAPILWQRDAIPTVQPSTSLPFALASVGRTFGFGVVCDADARFLGIIDSAHVERCLKDNRADVTTAIASDYLLSPKPELKAECLLSEAVAALGGCTFPFLPVCDREGSFVGLLVVSQLSARELRP
ncbi:hypothetical protein FHX15_006267 [Rhizobium sp. BK650]|nr:hypothetical protein [Rhizobium sp. BK650]